MGKHRKETPIRCIHESTASLKIITSNVSSVNYCEPSEQRNNDFYVEMLPVSRFLYDLLSSLKFMVMLSLALTIREMTQNIIFCTWSCLTLSTTILGTWASCWLHLTSRIMIWGILCSVNNKKNNNVNMSFYSISGSISWCFCILSREA